LSNDQKSNESNRKSAKWPELIAGVIYQIVSTSNNKYQEPDDKYREAQDRASRRTAYATIAMAIFTMAIFVVGVFQYLVTNGQLVEMRDQSTLTRQQLRARIRLEFAQLAGSDKSDKAIDLWGITPNWQNGGNTEANNFSGWVSKQLFVPDAARDFDFRRRPPVAEEAVPSTITQGSGIQQGTRVVSQDEMEKASAGAGNLIIWGYVEYTDVFFPTTNWHHVYYCNKAVPYSVGPPNMFAFSFPLYRKECNYSD
jgi:hypothetical protein